MSIRLIVLTVFAVISVTVLLFWNWLDDVKSLIWMLGMSFSLAGAPAYAVSPFFRPRRPPPTALTLWLVQSLVTLFMLAVVAITLWGAMTGSSSGINSVRVGVLYMIVFSIARMLCAAWAFIECKKSTDDDLAVNNISCKYMIASCLYDILTVVIWYFEEIYYSVW